jgi:predicted protein tyrosine phosphatase
MLKEVTESLAFGDESVCSRDTSGQFAIVHACKEPCHRRAVGYTARSLPRTHPHYLVLERGYHLYLNVIDPDQPLFMMPTFAAFLGFVDKHIAERRVIIHCNQGESRAPSFTLLYMAKRLKLLPDDSYQAAAEAFRKRFSYTPGRGIVTWLASHWNELP